MKPDEQQSSDVPEVVQLVGSEPIRPLPIAPPPSRKKRLLIIIAVIATIVIIGGGVAVYYLVNRQAVSTNESEQSSAVVNSSALQSATNAYTGGSTNESQLTQTDDSQLGSDTSASAGNMGESINENNL